MIYLNADQSGQGADNQTSASLDAYQEQLKKKKKTAVRLMALVTAVAFLILSFSGALRLFGLPPLEFLLESRQLSQESDIALLKQSVLSVSANGSRGTGFILADKQLAVTNYHILEQASQLEIRDINGRQSLYLEWHEAPELDLAIFKIDSHEIDGLELETDALPDLGDTVLMIGNPLGFFNIVNEATYLGFAELTGWDISLIKIQGPVYKGNSGSPVINQDGKVIGVLFATSKDPPSDGELPFGYVIPAAAVADTAEAAGEN